VAREAVKLGFTDVARFPGGIADWFAAHYFRQTLLADDVEWWIDNSGFPTVDVRTAVEYAAGHIPGARSEPLADLAVDPAATLAGLEAQGFILYDQGPPGATLYDVARRLEEAGFLGVYVYGAGYADWEASGKAVE
jgi:rhodanese-related sulfurtransferase